MVTFCERAACWVDPMFSLYNLLVILVISRFGFEGGIWVLIATVSIHCLIVAFLLSEFLYIQQHLLEALNTTERQSHTSYGYRRPYRQPHGSRDMDTYIPPDIRFLRDEYPRKAYWTNNVNNFDLFDSPSVPRKRTSRLFDTMQHNPSINIPEVMLYVISTTELCHFHLKKFHLKKQLASILHRE